LKGVATCGRSVGSSTSHEVRGPTPRAPNGFIEPWDAEVATPRHCPIPSPRESGERARERGRRAFSRGRAPLPPRFPLRGLRDPHLHHLPRSLRSRPRARRPLSLSRRHFGSFTPCPHPRAFAAPSPAARGEANFPDARHATPGGRPQQAPRARRAAGGARPGPPADTGACVRRKTFRPGRWQRYWRL
jgi:hypothetical protein